MEKKVQITGFGGVDRLTVSADAPAEPGPGQIRIRHDAIGVSFIDIYHRTGLYPLPLPATLGVEGAGVVEAVGPGVTRLSPGDRVAYAGAMGSYADEAAVPADRLVSLPDDVSSEVGAAAWDSCEVGSPKSFNGNGPHFNSACRIIRVIK